MKLRAKSIRVVAADSNHMVCRLLSDALNKQPGVSVVGLAMDYESLRQSIQNLKPDVALISSTLRGGLLLPEPCDGESNRLPQCPWVLLLDEGEPHLVAAAFRAGARGVFSRAQSDMGLLAKCVRRVTEGQIWMDNRHLLCLLEAFAGNDNGKQHKTNGTPKLTPREESVVRLVIQGRVNREIAEELQLSEHTIKNYLFRIFDKLGVSNRVELALYAVARLNLPDEIVA